MKRPRAKVPICWICDRQLWAGGTSYVTIIEHGHEHPAHHDCARNSGAVVKAGQMTEEG